MFIIFIPITQQPVHDRLAENQSMAGLSNLNEYENEYDNGMGESENELEFTYYSQASSGKRSKPLCIVG